MEDIIRLVSPQATATISCYGGQVMNFAPQGGDDVLWCTSPSFLEDAKAAGKPLRGGIPLCWPWVGAHPTHNGAPSHGMARISMWTVEMATDNAATLSFTTSGEDEYFPYVAKATLRVALQGAVLHVALTTENLGDETFSVTQALHTYLNIGNIETVQVKGVEGLPRHIAGGGAVLPPQQGVLTFHDEHDVVYDTVPGLIKVAAPTINRTLVVQTPIDGEAVLWNPGPQKGAKLDIPPGAYKSFVCVEPADIDHPVVLEKGASHTLAMRLWQQPYQAE